ncbi:MAG: glycosyltransferase, partial [Bacteroidota bacterium]
MTKYSIIIPVYNRPEEVDELLKSLTLQTYTDFEVIIVEDGSSETCKRIVLQYQDVLNIAYHYKENTGQGFSRNFGFEKSTGQWVVFYDSDCVIPENYFENLNQLVIDGEFSAFSGPDAARKDFSLLQKAISYSMTSFLTTGGIRGRKVKVDGEAHLRSYNLVIKADVFDHLKGFAKTNMGEDMELSFRFNRLGYRAMISETLKVYHKRRNSLGSFFRQVFSFGRTRIQLKRKYSIPIKIPHFFPTLFFIGLILGVFGFV